MRRIVVLGTWLVLALASAGFAQGVQTGTLRGIILDSSGASLPGVTVTATSPAMQGPRSVVTEADGGYVLRSIPAGEYDVVFELSGFETVTRKVIVLLGQEAAQNATLQIAGVSVDVEVVAPAPAPILTPVGGQNLKHDEVDALASRRDLLSISTLAPGLTTNTPNTGQVSINGAFGFDNVFMVNGVDINDNLYGSPRTLFVEDAIEETQVLTRGVTAEYGRFTGGVVNAITKSGGNKFSGSFRVNFQNEQWTTRTPFELCDPAVTAAGCTPAPDRPDELHEIYEGTFGGPIVKDRLWFFGAGRYLKTADSSSLAVTNLPNTSTTTDKRGEIKITGTIRNHTMAGGYLDDPSEVTNTSGLAALDTASLINPSYPNWYTYFNYHGVFGTKLLAEAQFSHRKFQYLNSGGSSTNLVDSPFVSLQPFGNYNAPIFDATDPETRAASQITGNVTYFLDTGKRGRHEIKGGYEFFRSQEMGGNSQSSTDYVFLASYAVDASGSPIIDNGRMIPVFAPFGTLLLNFIPVRGATLNVDNNSFFAQDHWAINSHWSADLGVRYERVRSESTTESIVGIDTNTVVPRLAVAYDVQGNGRHIIHATYGHYSGRYNEALIGANSSVANPQEFDGIYVGPAGQGRDFAPGFDPSNYVTVFANVPTKNVSFEPGLSSPIVKEFTTSYGTSFAHGYGEAAYIWRNTGNFIEDFIDIKNGTTTLVHNGEEFIATKRIYRNTDVADRAYQALEFQGRYNIQSRWRVSGSYTLQLQNNGNFEGDAPFQPAIPSPIGDYPEIWTEARQYPTGKLFNFQRHKLILWSTYDFAFHRAGGLSLSGLWRVNSATTYSLAAVQQPLTDIQVGTLAAAGYPDQPSSQTIYFGNRGTESFAGYGVLDISLNYNVPVLRSLRPYVKMDVYNLLNNQKLIGWDTTIGPDPNSPVDSLGVPTGYVKAPQFGKANSNADFPVPFLGYTNTGGRTMRLAVGFRF